MGSTASFLVLCHASRGLNRKEALNNNISYECIQQLPTARPQQHFEGVGCVMINNVTNGLKPLVPFGGLLAKAIAFGFGVDPFSSFGAGRQMKMGMMKLEIGCVMDVVKCWTQPRLRTTALRAELCKFPSFLLWGSARLHNTEFL
eukprot:150342-Amphidinium_carterae.1